VFYTLARSKEGEGAASLFSLSVPSCLFCAMDLLGSYGSDDEGGSKGAGAGSLTETKISFYEPGLSTVVDSAPVVTYDSVGFRAVGLEKLF
jgi:hypothetical protein